jgi:hypothetical protein
MRYTTVLLLVLASACLGSINPGKGIPTVVMYEGDALAQNMSEAFNLSHLRGHLKSETTLGRMYGEGIPFQSKDYSAYGVEKLTVAKWVSHNIAVFVYDNHKVVFQIIDGNGKALLKTYFHDFNILQNIYCSGFEYNSDRNVVYVGCFGAHKGMTPGKLLISTFDLHTGTVVAETSLDQQDGFDIKNELELRIINAPQESNEENYLIAYDKGVGMHDHSRHNHQFRVFRNVSYRKLTFYYLGEIESYDHTHQILYDLFPYNGTIIMTGRTMDTRSIITTTQCKLNNAERILNCGNVKPTLVTEGYVGIYNGSVMLTVDTPSRIVTAYQLKGNYSDKTWSSEQLNQMIHTNLIDTENVWISSAQYSPHGASLMYA